MEKRSSTAIARLCLTQFGVCLYSVWIRSKFENNEVGKSTQSTQHYKTVIGSGVSREIDVALLFENLEKPYPTAPSTINSAVNVVLNIYMWCPNEKDEISLPPMWAHYIIQRAAMVSVPEINMEFVCSSAGHRLPQQYINWSCERNLDYDFQNS